MENLLKIVLIILVCLKFTRSQPKINCGLSESIYHCNFIDFDTTILGFELSFVPINHEQGYTNSLVIGVSAQENQKIETFPTGIFTIFPNLKTLSMIKVGMKTLNGTLYNCTNLIIFDLRWNLLKQIPSGLFDECNNIQYVRFGFNEITSIPDGIFDKLPELYWVELDNNQLTSLPATLVANAPNLYLIRFNGNNLTSIPKNLFENNLNLTYFPMEENPGINGILPEYFLANKFKLTDVFMENIKLSEFPKGIFTNATALVNIHLQNNKISRIRDGIFNDLLNLQNLELHKNFIERIEKEAFNGLGNLQNLTLNGNRIKFLNVKIFQHTPNLIRLNVKNNPIIAISYDIFDVLHNIEEFSITDDADQSAGKEHAKTLFFDIIQCEFSSSFYGYSSDIIDPIRFTNFDVSVDDLDKTSDVDYVKASVEMNFIPVEIFMKFPNATIVDFSNTSLSDEDGRSRLDGCSRYCENVEIIVLDNNRFTKIPSYLKYFKNLQEVSLVGNQINQVPSETFKGLQNLGTLNISSNNVTSFQDFSTFSTIDLSYNPTTFNITITNDVTVLILNHYTGTASPTTVGRSFEYCRRLKELYISNRKISSLNGFKFNRILEVLDVSFNLVKSLDSATGLDNLKNLSLSNNLITEISKDFFENLINLEVLDLSSNKIEDIEEFSFQNMTELTHLFLDNNLIKVLYENTFSGLQNLITLSISRNKLRVIQDKVFAHPPNLLYLNISNNNLTSLNTEMFGFFSNDSNIISKLESLDASNNKIKVVSRDFKNYFSNSSINSDENSCEYVENCPEILEIKCNYNYYQNFTYECFVEEGTAVNKNFKHIIIGQHKGNEKSSNVKVISAGQNSYFDFLPLEIFNEFPNLRVLNFEKNYITQLIPFVNCSNLEVVKLSGNKLISISNSYFENCPKIEYLDLDSNMIRFMDDKSFHNLLQLNFLNIGGNEIKKLSSIIFDKNTQLEVLKISANIFVEINEKIFSSLRNLKNLAIYDNKIENLPESIFRSLQSLEQLEMQKLNLTNGIPNSIFARALNLKSLSMYGNNISKIDEKLFENLENLEILDLNSCEIEKIHENSFDKLVNLKILVLKLNEIEEIGSLENLRSLEVLNIECNKISHFPQNFLKNSANLVEFYANENNITKLDDFMFENFTNLEILELESNKISQLYPKSLQNLKNLRTFKFNYNNLTELDQIFFKTLSNLQNIFVHDNKISTLHPRQFENLTELITLDISSNDLTSIKANTFESSRVLKNFKEIYLSDNKIEAIEILSFQMMPNLKILDLQGNRIKTLSSSMFGERQENFPKLVDKIDISYNQVNKISQDFFQKIFPSTFNAVGNVCVDSNSQSPHLPESNSSKMFEKCKSIILECRNVELENFEGSGHKSSDCRGDFKRIGIKVKDSNRRIDFNQNTSLTSNYKCLLESKQLYDDIKNFDFEVKFDGVTNDTIKVVEFLYSTVKFVPQILFNNLPNLEVLIARNVHMTNLNKLENCTSLKVLVLNDNDGISLGNNNLENCKNLEVLSLNNANVVIDNSAFYGLSNLKEIQMKNSKVLSLNFYLPSSLEILIMSENILNVKTETFQSIPNLRVLCLDSYLGSISDVNLDKNAFLGLTSLEFLDISNRGVSSTNFPSLSEQNNLKILKSNSNSLTELNEDVVSSFTELLEMHMESNSINFISNFTFRKLNKIEVINLQGSNRISSLNTNAFHELSSLKILLLGKNQIQRIPKDTFKDLKNLQTLSLYTNKIEVVEAEAFNGLENLRNLDLKSNSLSGGLNWDTFRKLSKLENLTLDDCSLDELPSSILRLENLKNLKFARNSITSLMFSPNFHQLSSIDFSSNKISKISRKFFKSVPKDVKILAYPNQCVKNIQNSPRFEDCYLNFEQFNFCTIEKHVKYGTACKVNITENLNHEVSKSEVRYLYNKKISMKYEIYVIFEVFENLTSVELWNSSITNTIGITNCANLRNLDLRMNFIETLYENSFIECENLDRIIFYKNRIRFVDKYAFRGLKALTLLDLSYNQIKSLEIGTFENLLKLQKLFLNSNQISQIQSELFKNLANLRVLKLSNNYLTKLVDQEIFQNFPDIHEIFLNVNKITEVNPLIFRNLNNLRYLNIEYNNLNEIDLTKMTTKKLNYVDVSFNNLTVILINKDNFSYVKGFISEENPCLDAKFADLGEENMKKLENCGRKNVKINNDEL